MQTEQAETTGASAIPVAQVTEAEAKKPVGKGKRWGKRLGVAGFCFFFFKGMLWLIIPAWVVMERGCVGG